METTEQQWWWQLKDFSQETLQGNKKKQSAEGNTLQINKVMW